MQKIAIIGCGMMGKTHSKAYQNMKDLDICVKYVSDLDHKKAEVCAQMLNAEIQTLENILKDPEITIIDLCTQTFTHAELTEKAASMGKNIFCEKPIALSITDAQRMIDVCKKNNVKLSVGHVVRFFPEYMKAKEILETPDMGSGAVARFYRGGNFPSHGTDNWFDDIKKSGGVFVDLSIHDFDYLRTVFGEPESIIARSVKLSETKECKNNDHGLAVIRFKNGVLAHVEGSWAEPDNMPVGFHTKFEVNTKNGMIHFDATESMTFNLQLKRKQNNYVAARPSEYNPYEQELRVFIDAVQNGSEVKVSGEEALKSLRVALAANISAKEKRPVLIEEVK
ncbi:MAG TPA: Gfo/Idh/MocA family oxidoreductase [Petrotogaceae bacterium]|nr:Gfo/Idh/MocA family oxidoreductase [Petrotogaceae bacterium]